MFNSTLVIILFYQFLTSTLAFEIMSLTFLKIKFKIWNCFIYISIWLVCLFVCLYPINVKTAEPIEPKFVVGPRVTPWKVYEWSNDVKNLPLTKFNLWKFWKSTIFFYKICEICFCLQREHVQNWNRRWVRSAKKPSKYILCLSVFFCYR